MLLALAPTARGLRYLLQLPALHEPELGTSTTTRTASPSPRLRERVGVRGQA
jgi:hypothetical protein